MRIVLLAALVAATGCSRTVKHEVTIKVEETWRKGLSDEQAAQVQKDKEVASALLDKLMAQCADQPAPESDDYKALQRLKSYHTEFMNASLAGNLKIAAPRFRKQLEGKTVQLLAAEQRAEDAKGQ